MNNWDYFHSNANIEELNIGILYIDKNGIKYCYCTDLMKLPDKCKESIVQDWVKVLHLQSEPFKCDSNNKWEKILQTIELGMLIQ